MLDDLYSFPTRRSSDLTLQARPEVFEAIGVDRAVHVGFGVVDHRVNVPALAHAVIRDRKSTRLNSSHSSSSYAVFCLKKKIWLTPDLRIKKSLLKCNWT